MFVSTHEIVYVWLLCLEFGVALPVSPTKAIAGALAQNIRLNAVIKAYNSLYVCMCLCACVICENALTRQRERVMHWFFHFKTSWFKYILQYIFTLKSVFLIPALSFSFSSFFSPPSGFTKNLFQSTIANNNKSMNIKGIAWYRLFI